MIAHWILFAYGTLGEVPKHLPFCESGSDPCGAAAALVWQRTVAAARAANDACHFTAFTAYEWSGFSGTATLHRNVIFASDQVPDRPISFIDATEAQDLWNALKKECLEAQSGCDVLAIPHNPNLSSGLAFLTENADGSLLTAAQATLRALVEPLVEIFQHKGASECAPAAGSPDELCDFEQVKTSVAADEAKAFVRSALKEGLALGQALGVNPFKLGFVGATDTHNGTPGATEEDLFVGHMGATDDELKEQVSLDEYLPWDRARYNPGGLTVVWAEENTREAIFRALRRRETYATSGTRPIVRFFGGWDYAANACQQSDLPAIGYQGGVPMGGELVGFPQGKTAPRFLISATRDPGTGARPGTALQRIQIVKGFLKDDQRRERVYDVSGDAFNGATVDLSTCTRQGGGFDHLCQVWTDPDFDSTQPAFYYVRVIENPTCRWSVVNCNAQQVDCSKPALLLGALKSCCDNALKKPVQERAWTSPIWYTPQGV
jgi:hypothetical protein